MLVIVPPQPYFEVVHKAGYAGSYLDFMRLYFTGYGGFCRDGHCLILPTWNHLWFVAYLWVYSVLLWALLRRAPGRAGCAGATRARRRCAGRRLLVLPIAALALLRIALGGALPVDACAGRRLVQPCACTSRIFLLGAAVRALPALWPRLAAAALARRSPSRSSAWVRARWLYAGRYTAPTRRPSGAPAARVAYATMQWCAIVAAIGFAHRHLNRDHRWRRYADRGGVPGLHPAPDADHPARRKRCGRCTGRRR